MAAPWDPRGVVLGPAGQSEVDPDETDGERILRETIAAISADTTRVRVDWRGAPSIGGTVMNIETRHLRHDGPCPAVFAPGDQARVVRSWLSGGIREGEIVRITGTVAGGLLTAQTPDGRHAELYRTQMVRVFAARIMRLPAAPARKPARGRDAP